MARSRAAAKPNIVVIWGDDIGIANLSCYTHGLMGYQTPNIDRIAQEGMRFTDLYAEQSCTAGRASFITGQHGLRTGLTKVGLPAATVGLHKEDPTIAALLEAVGLRHRADRQEPPRRPQRISAHRPRLRRVLRQSLPPERRGRAGTGGLPEGVGFSALSREVRPARRVGMQGHRRGRRDGRPALWQGRQTGHPRHRPADQEADGNDRRRHRRPGRGIHQAAGAGRHNPSSSG